MSWSLRVSNGDLVLTGAKFETVANENKLVQDLRHFILERMGTDESHPSYGSLIDGGVRPNGIIVESVIARTDWAQVKLEIQSEIHRITNMYQRMQIERAKRERLRYNKNTLSRGEVLAAVTAVNFRQNADTLFVTIAIESGRGIGAQLDLTLPSVIST